MNIVIRQQYHSANTAKTRQNARKFQNQIQQNAIFTFFTCRFYLPQKERNLLISKFCLIIKNCQKIELPLWTIGACSYRENRWFWVKNDMKLQEYQWDVTKLISHKGNAIGIVLSSSLCVWLVFFGNSLSGQQGWFWVLNRKFVLVDFVCHLRSM